MTAALILCAGFGTRLRPLTEELPKPLVPLGDRPVLSHIMARLKAAGVAKVVLNVHQHAEIFRSQVSGLPMKAQLVVEPRIRGTAGGIAGARAALGPAPVIVHTGDIITQPPVARLLACVGDGLCLAVRRRPLGEGPLGLDEDGAVVRLRGQVFGPEHSGADYIGVGALGNRCLASMPEFGCLMQDWALIELGAGRRITTVESAAEWTDIGGLDAYLEANLAWLGARQQHVAPTAEVSAKVELTRSIVGAGATVQGRGLLRECVVWPGARAVAPLSRAVITSTHAVACPGSESGACAQ